MTQCDATTELTRLGLPGGVTLHCVLTPDQHFLRGCESPADSWHLAVVNGTAWTWNKDSLRPVKFQGVRLTT